MKQLVAPLLLCAGLAIFGATAFSANEQAETAPLLSRLKVGQRVNLTEASGGYEFVIFNSRKNLDERAADFVPHKVVQVGPDFVAVDLGRGMERAIAAHAIVGITTLSENFGESDSPDSESRSRE